MQDIEDRLRNAAQAVKDDIRGVFRTAAPEYKNYLVELLIDAADEIEDLHGKIPVPAPE